MKKIAIEIRWAIQFSIVSLVWMIFEKTMGWHDELISKQAIYTNLFAFVGIGIYFIALSDKKKNYYKGTMDWKQGFMSGMILSTIIAILSPMVQSITYTYITPHFFENIIKYMVTEKVQTQSQAEMYFNLKSFTIQGIFGAFSFGVLTSAFVAFVLKTKITTHEK
ncbi:MAG: DUF4199 domain-containing protein [Flavobacterium sp.]|nr:DUF4199 domain-containing protein [Flavobacterium sp.]